MTFEFLITCHADATTNIYDVLVELLSLALDYDQDDVDEETVRAMIELRHERFGNVQKTVSGESSRQRILGFSVDLLESESAENVIQEFSHSLTATESIYHAIKFEDPLLHEMLAQIASEIFKIEMKLRRVLSFIYLHAHPNEDPYKLLQQDLVKTTPESLNRNQMISAVENQLFYLSFSQYVELNQRPQPELAELLVAVRDAEQYEAFRELVTRSPIGDSRDLELLGDLKDLMRPIERMRNCVAHNRRPSSRIREDYSLTRPELEARLDRYLEALQRS